MTIKYWLTQLPEEYSSLAINETTRIRLDAIVYSTQEALLGCFQWRKSSQGFNFWANIFIKYGKY